LQLLEPEKCVHGSLAWQILLAVIFGKRPRLHLRLLGFAAADAVV
jgi:hypothetical protein